MNKRIILNIMIIALLAFYLIFNNVYQKLVNKHEPLPGVDIWEQPFLVPEPWQLTRLEMKSLVIQIDKQGNWSSTSSLIDVTRASDIAVAWQQLEAAQAVPYQQLPLEGETILAFIAEDSQPLVFRVLEQAEEIQFFRMIDQKQFNFTIANKVRLLPK